MEKAELNFLEQFDESRRQYAEEFITDNSDLDPRMKQEGVTITFDIVDDVLSITIGPVVEAESFTSDGELYLRTALGSRKLVGAELHSFTEHVRDPGLPLQIMHSFLEMAGPAPWTIHWGANPPPKGELGSNIREMVEAR